MAGRPAEDGQVSQGWQAPRPRGFDEPRLNGSAPNGAPVNGAAVNGANGVAANGSGFNGFAPPASQTNPTGRTIYQPRRQ